MGMDLRIARVESVALANISSFKSEAKPTNALLGTSMSKRIRHDITLRFALQSIVANCAGRSESFLDVALLEQSLLLRVVRPDSRQKICLQFQSD